MSLYKEIIEKILNEEEIDKDIKEILMKEETHGQIVYKGYDLLQDPAQTILSWQLLRNGQRSNHK